MSDVINLTYNSNHNSKQRTKKIKTKKRLNNFKESLQYLPKQESKYLIPEIDIKDYIFSIKRLYQLIERKKQDYENYDDLFMKRIFLAQTGGDESTWNQFDYQRRSQQALSAVLGDFHEELAGKIKGYRTLPLGHWSKHNVIGYDKESMESKESKKIKEIYEWKNRVVYDSKILLSIYENFKDLIDTGKTDRCILVFVNVPDGWTAPKPILKKSNGQIKIDLTGEEYKDKIFIISGKQAYGHMSGKADFFDRLLTTMANTFADKSMKDYLDRLESAMNEAD